MGAVSVMPQAWMMVSPCLSNPRMRASGAAEPPTTMRTPPGLSAQRWGSLSSAPWMPIQMVGTPAPMLTCSPAIRSSRLSASRCGPGKTSLAPTITAAKGRPHALT